MTEMQSEFMCTARQIQVFTYYFLNYSIYDQTICKYNIINKLYTVLGTNTSCDVGYNFPFPKMESYHNMNFHLIHLHAKQLEHL